MRRVTLLALTMVAKGAEEAFRGGGGGGGMVEEEGEEERRKEAGRQAMGYFDAICNKVVLEKD